MKTFTIILTFLSMNLLAQEQQVSNSNAKVYQHTSAEVAHIPQPQDPNKFKDWLKANNQLYNQLQSYHRRSSVQLILTVNEEGALIDVKIWRGIEHKFDKEAVRLIKEQPNQWKPGTLKNGEAATVSFYYNLEFKD